MRAIVPASVLLTAAIITAGCAQLRSREAVVMGPGCNMQNLPFSGSLVGKRQAVIDELGANGGRLHQRPDRAAKKPADSPNPTFTLIPTCRDYQFTMGDLVDGRFVGLIIVRGDDSLRFSGSRNDQVAWWVYGVTGDDGTIRLHSQFASLTAETEAEFIRGGTFVSCERVMRWTQEEAGWHDNSCPPPTAPMVLPSGGDNPWFGCTRGCCYAVADEA